MVKKIIIDSSVYIDYLRAGKGIYRKLIDLSVRGDAILYTPVVVILELWIGKSMNRKAVEEQVIKSISPTKLINITREICEEAGILIRKGLVNDRIDSIIVATALHCGAIVATSNKKHFQGIKGLRLFE